MLSLFLALLTTTGPSGYDDDAVLAAMVAATPLAGELHLSTGRTYVVHRPVKLLRPVVVEGEGATIRAADHAAIGSAVVRSEGVNGIVIRRLTIDANVDGGGADYGIWITGGAGHRIEDVTIRDTSQACVAVEDAVAIIQGNRLDRCGRELNLALGGATNNHGIMVFALSRNISGVSINNNLISHAYRKGITSYVRASGKIEDLTIRGNYISDCGLGGIYIAGAPRSSPQARITLDRNISERNYVGFEFDNVTDINAIGNEVKETRDRAGAPGGDGVILHNVRRARLDGIAVTNSGAGGISIQQSAQIQLLAPRVFRPNAGRLGFGPGIRLLDTRDSSVEGAVVEDDRPVPQMTHGLIEQGSSRNNKLVAGRIAGATAKSIVRSP